METGVRTARAKLLLLVYTAWYVSRSTEKRTKKGEEERLSVPVAKLDENNKKYKGCSDQGNSSVWSICLAGLKTWVQLQHQTSSQILQCL